MPLFSSVSRSFKVLSFLTHFQSVQEKILCSTHQSIPLFSQVLHRCLRYSPVNYELLFVQNSMSAGGQVPQRRRVVGA